MKTLILAIFSLVSLAAYATDEALPELTTRDRDFQSAGLTADVAGWDELKKDLLHLHAEDLDAAALVKKYPAISVEKLQKLQRAAHAH